MRHLIPLLLMTSMLSAVRAAPVAPPAHEVISAFPLASIPIPNQTVSGWYARGDAEREARSLETYLRTLVWGLDRSEDREAEGRQIEVALETGQVLVRDTQENVERIQREVNPTLEQSLQTRAFESDGLARRVSSSTFTTAPEVGRGLISNRPRETVDTSARDTASARTTTTRTLRLDDSMTFRDLRITLLDVTGDFESQRPAAVILVDTTISSDEMEISERRSVVFENYRIRCTEIRPGAENRVTLEVTDLIAQSR